MPVINFQIQLRFHFMRYDTFERALEGEKWPVASFLLRSIDPRKYLPYTFIIPVTSQVLIYPVSYLRAA